MPFAWTAVHLANIVSSAGQPDRDSDSEGGEEARLTEEAWLTGRGVATGKERGALCWPDSVPGRLSKSLSLPASHRCPPPSITVTPSSRASTRLDRPPPTGAPGPDK